MIEGAVAGRITVEEAASLLQLSERQVKRLKQRSSDGSGAQWVYHGNRERTPANRTAECLRQQVVSLAREKYSGFNDSHFQQKLEATEKVSVSRSTVRRILRSAGIGSPRKRRAAKYRSRRERRAQEGMMVLTDANT